MKAELLSHFGDDLMITNCARVSYGKNKVNFDQKDEKLIKYLVEHGHTSVFRHPQLQFRLTFPIFVERQIFKHTVGITTNSISGRYVDFSDDYYIIDQFRYQSKDSKQGSSEDLIQEDNIKAIEIYKNAILSCEEAYCRLCELGVAKEQARAILPLGLESQCIWTGSILAFINMMKQRLDSHAQKETRELATYMLNAVKNIPGSPFIHTLKAFNL